MLQTEIKADLPDRIAHGFLQADRLQELAVDNVRCYQSDKFHTGFTLFSPEGTVYVQMYQLPKGERKLEEDLAFQVDGKKWGKAPKEDLLHLKIFPAGWTHVAFWLNPKCIVHQYRGPNRAVFIRYLGRSIRDPLFLGFNHHLRYLPDLWHTELVDHILAPPTEMNLTPAPAATVDAVDLRVEQAAIRKMILKGVKRFGSDQRKPGGDVHDLPVTGIIVWFDIGNGYVSVGFDVRAPFEVDGAYSHEDFAALPRENWRQFGERHNDGHAVTLTGLDGQAVKIRPGSDFNVAEAFGLMVLALLKSMRTEKEFAPLILAPDSELIIEADDIAFGWPQYEDRGKDNRI